MVTESTENKKALVAFVKATEISHVQLVNSDFSIHLPPENVHLKNIDLAFSRDVKWFLGNDSEEAKTKNSSVQLFCFVGTTITGKVKEEDPHFKQLENAIAFAGKCQFAVRYTVEASVSDESLIGMFAGQFAFPHAYPYIRSFFDSQFALMGLPRILLPILKFNSDASLIANRLDG